jgi:hypothetical protein
MYGYVLLSVMRSDGIATDPGTITKLQGFGFSLPKIRGFTQGNKAGKLTYLL